MSFLEELSDLAILALGRSLAFGGTGSAVAVLIDKAVSDPLQDTPHLGDAIRSAVRISHDDLTESRWPYLLWIEDSERAERLLNETVRLAVQEAHANLGSARQARSVCAWIRVGTPSLGVQPERRAASLAGHIARAAVVRSPGGERRLLRYFDPRVLQRLEAVARPGQIAQLLGEGTSWHYIGRDLSLRKLDAPAMQPEALFDPQQWERLMRMGWVNELLPQAVSWGLKGQDMEVAERIDAQLARAQAAGLRTDTDCMTFATCVFCVHPRFDEHPFFAEMISEASRGELSFADAASSLDEQQLEEVAAGDWLNRSSGSARHG